MTQAWLLNYLANGTKQDKCQVGFNVDCSRLMIFNLALVRVRVSVLRFWVIDSRVIKLSDYKLLAYSAIFIIEKFAFLAQFDPTSRQSVTFRKDIRSSQARALVEENNMKVLSVDLTQRQTQITTIMNNGTLKM